MLLPIDNEVSISESRPGKYTALGGYTALHTLQAGFL